MALQIEPKLVADCDDLDYYAGMQGDSMAGLCTFCESNSNAM
jgi:hypothetical protein